DHLLAQLPSVGDGHDWNQRNVGVSVPGHDVAVDRDHPRNHDGRFFSVLVTRTVNQPQPGSDEICRALEEAWLGTAGYLRADGTRQSRALAFLGEVVTDEGQHVHEVFVVDLPDDVTQPGDDGPLAGTAMRRPRPPRGTVQRRLTFTANRQHPGVQGPRHWLRSSPDGARIACLMKDDAGVVQLWTVSPLGGAPRQVTQHSSSIESAFSWSPDGRGVAYVCAGRIVVTDAASGSSRYLTVATEPASAPRPEAVIYSPDGDRIAFVRPVVCGDRRWNQIFSVASE
ncbi:MAG TPA: DUF3748 domain-containing protein, partial [Pirellulaceae bacterium]|nr:DUF3748 domain-containing protein [Pirellulaceae bacterium]